MTEPDNSKWVEKLSALMRKAEDPATTEEERSTIIDKVTYLMTKYGVEQDMLRAKENRPLTASHRKFVVNRPYRNARVALINEVSVAFGCFMVDISNVESNKVSVFGTDEDIERVFMLYMSLGLQMDGALVQAQAYKPMGEHGKTFNSSFIYSFAQTVVIRIREAANRAKEDLKREYAGTGMELVLKSKQELILDLMLDIYPNLKMNRSSMSARSAAGHAAGHAAGQRADIGGSRISGTHSARRAING